MAKETFAIDMTVLQVPEVPQSFCCLRLPLYHTHFYRRRIVLFLPFLVHVYLDFVPP